MSRTKNWTTDNIQAFQLAVLDLCKEQDTDGLEALKQFCREMADFHFPGYAAAYNYIVKMTERFHIA